jgi:hypothetical protein
MFWFLRKRIDILAETDEFIESFGEDAYQEARNELAKAFERGDTARMKLLESVSKEIAKRSAVDRDLDEQASQDPYSIGHPKGVRLH